MKQVARGALFHGGKEILNLQIFKLTLRAFFLRGIIFEKVNEVRAQICIKEGIILNPYKSLIRSATFSKNDQYQISSTAVE
jgi:hypothetical protein